MRRENQGKSTDTDGGNGGIQIQLRSLFGIDSTNTPPGPTTPNSGIGRRRSSGITPPSTSRSNRRSDLYENTRVSSSLTMPSSKASSPRRLSTSPKVPLVAMKTTSSSRSRSRISSEMKSNNSKNSNSASSKSKPQQKQRQQNSGQNAAHTVQTPYVPRSLSFDLSNEKKKRLSSAGKMDTGSVGGGGLSVHTDVPKSITMSVSDADYVTPTAAEISNRGLMIAIGSASSSNSRNMSMSTASTSSRPTPMTAKKKTMEKVRRKIAQGNANASDNGGRNGNISRGNSKRRNRSSTGVNNVNWAHSPNKDYKYERGTGGGVGKTPITGKKDIKRGRGSAGSIKLQRSSSGGISQGDGDMNISMKTISPASKGEDVGIDIDMSMNLNDSMLDSPLVSPLRQSKSTAQNSNDKQQQHPNPPNANENVFDLQVLDSILETNLQMNNSSHHTNADTTSSSFPRLGLGDDGNDSTSDSDNDNANGKNEKDSDDEGSNIINDFSSLLSDDNNSSKSCNDAKEELVDQGESKKNDDGENNAEGDDDSDAGSDVSLSEMLKKLDKTANGMRTRASPGSPIGSNGSENNDHEDKEGEGTDEEVEEIDLNNLDILFTPAPSTSPSCLAPGRADPEAQSTSSSSSLAPPDVQRNTSVSERFEAKDADLTTANLNVVKNMNMNVSSYSDTEAVINPIITNEHLEDILAKGGEEALDRVLELSSKGDSTLDGNGKKNNDELGTAIVEADFALAEDQSENSVVQPFHLSFINNGPSLDNQFLRANLKSALIALRSVKAERKDIETNVLQLQNILEDTKIGYKHEFEKVQSDILQKDTEVLSLQVALSQAQKQNQEHEKRAAALKDEMIKNQCGWQMAESELDDIKSYMHAAELEVESHRCRAEDLEEQLVQFQTSIEEMIALHGELGDAQHQVSVLEKEMQFKNDQIEEQNAQLSNMQAKVHHSHVERDSFAKKLEASEQQISDMALRLDEAKEDMQVIEQETEERIARLRDELDSALKSCADALELEAKLDNANAHLLYAKAQVMEKENECDAERKKNETITDELSSARSQIGSIQQRLMSFDCNYDVDGDSVFLLGNVDNQMKDLKDQCLRMHEDSEKMRNRVTEMENLLANSQQSSDKNVKNFVQLEIALADARSKILSLENQNSSKDETVTSLKKALDSKDHTVVSLNEALNQLKDEIERQNRSNENNDRIEQEMKEMVKRRKELEDELNLKNDQIFKLTAALEDLKLETETLKSADVEKDELVGKLSARLEDAKANSESLENQMNVFSEKEEDMANQISLLEEAVRAKDEELRKLTETQDAQINHLKSTLEKAEMDADSFEQQIRLRAHEVNRLNGELERQNRSNENNDRIEQEMKEMVKRRKELEDELNLNNDQIFKLTTALEDLKLETETLKSADVEKDELVGKLSARLEDAKANSESLENQMNVFSEKEEDMANQISLLEEAVRAKDDMVAKKSTEAARLKLALDETEAEIDNIRRELKFSRLQSIKDGMVGQGTSSEVSSVSNNNEDKSHLKDGQHDAGDIAREDAKEAIKELVSELHNVIAEKDIALEGLSITQKDLQALKEDCNQRELEIIALEASLRKALALTTDDGIDGIDEEVRIVIGELVEEIARIKSNSGNSSISSISDKCTFCDTAKQKIDQLSKDLKMSDETADLEAERADIAESKIQNIMNHLKKIEAESNFDDESQSEASGRNKIFSDILDLLSDPIDNCTPPLFSDCDVIDSEEEEVHDKEKRGDTGEGEGNNEKSFVEELDLMLSQSENVMGNALAEFDNEFKSDYAMDDSEGYETLIVDKRNSVHVVQYHVYESLRRKCDMLEAEREDLLNETLALMDSSAAASAAEIEARIRMVENDAALRLEEHKRNAEQHLASVTEEYQKRLATYACKS